MAQNIICNNFGGIRRKSATFMFGSPIITAKDLQNVELYYTGINNGVGIRTVKGNVSICDSVPEDEEVINIFETTQGGIKYFLVHASSKNEGKLYLFDYATNSLIEKISSLSPTRISCGIDIAQGWSDLFVFSNGVDWIHTLQIGNVDSDNNPDEVKTLEVYDKENREIKGLWLANWKGRLWVASGNILRYSVMGNIKDFSTSDIEVITSAGFIEFAKNITAVTEYLTSLAVFFKDSSLLVEDNYPFITTKESVGGCCGFEALIFHGTELYFYDDTKKGLFSFRQVILGDKTLGENIAIEIQDELLNIDGSRTNEIKLISVCLSDRNEIWFYIPTTDNDFSTILIYDYLRQEWIKRKCQKINTIKIIDSKIFSAGKKIYSEYSGKDFDGEFIQNFYTCTNFNLGSNTSLKVLYLQPRICVDMPFSNNFYVKYVKNFNVFKKPKIKFIKSKWKNYLVWGIGRYKEDYWASQKTNIVTKLPNISAFKTLEMQFYTTNLNENFAIKNIEMNEVDLIQA